jgi:hypothetical protein
MYKEMSSSIISLAQLVNSVQTLTSTEIRNKMILETLSSETLVQNLHGWASVGFADSHCVYEYQLFPSAKGDGGKYRCSDGNFRDIWEYIPFCLGYSINELVANIQQQVTDIKLSFSLEEENAVILKIHATK